MKKINPAPFFHGVLNSPGKMKNDTHQAGFEVLKRCWINPKFKSSSGQALVTLLFFVLIGLTVISAAAVMVFGNIQSASVTEQGNYAYFVAESGIQEALIRIIRDPGYSGTPVGQPLSIGEGSVTIQVSSSSGVITATATGTFNNNVRKIQLQTVYNNNVASISSWKEIQ